MRSAISPICLRRRRAFTTLGLLALATTLSAASAESAVVDGAGKQPHAAIAADGIVHLVYAQGEALMTRASRDGGATFSAPLTVAKVDGLMVGMRRGPHIAAGSLAVVVGAIGKDGDLQAWRSLDHGATWSGPVTINDQPKTAMEGLFSLAAGPGGVVWATWLDLRSTTMEVYAAQSRADGTWAANARVYRSPDGEVCTCCQPTIAGDAGTVAIMWRNQVGGARDLWSCALDGAGKITAAAAKLGSGTWSLNACPMDGGGIAILGSRIETIWRREGTMYACGSADRRKEVALGPGSNGVVAILVSGVVRVWQRSDDIVMTRDGGPVTVLGRGRYPVIAAQADGNGPAVIAWEADEGVRVLALPAQKR